MAQSTTYYPGPGRPTGPSPYRSLAVLLSVLRLVLRNPSANMARAAMPLAYLLIICIPPLMLRSTDGLAAAFLGGLPLLAWFTTAVAGAVRRQLAFLCVLPLSVAPKWLVVIPCCALTTVMTAAAARVCHLSMAQLIWAVGAGWWAIAVGHWLTGRRWWLLATVSPLLCWAGAFVTGVCGACGGEPAAAVASLSLASGALLWSSPDQIVVRLLSGAAPARLLATKTGPVTVPSRARGARAGLVATKWRLWLVTTPRGARYAQAVGTLAFALASIATFPAMSPAWLGNVMPLASFIAAANSRASARFFGTRPLSRYAFWCGTLVPPLLMMLLMPLTALGAIEREFFMGPKAWAMLSGGAISQEKLRYLRAVVGATFLPDHVTRSGLPPSAWPALRPLLHLHVLRLTLLMLAAFFAIAGAMIEARSRGSKTLRILVALGAVALTVPCLPMPWRGAWPPPPIWLAASVAVATAISMSVPSVRR